MYTKEERHEIYKRSLARFEHKNSYFGDKYYNGMCAAIIDAIDEIYNIRWLHPKLYEYLPELTALCPDGGLYRLWWDPYDRQIRIENFKKIIEQTKP